MAYQTIIKALRRAGIALAACISLSACDDATNPGATQQSEIPKQGSDAELRVGVELQPILRAAGEGKDYQWGSDHIFVKLSRAETGGSLTLIQDNLKPGFDLGMHYHRTHTEIFYILEGEVEFVTDKTAFTARTGSVVYLPAGTPHAAKSSTGGRMLMFYTPGGFDGMLAEIENASWLERVSPFARARRDEKYDFNKGVGEQPVVADAPEPMFIVEGEGKKVSFSYGDGTLKLSDSHTNGLATMHEEMLKPGSKRVFTLSGNQAEILFVLEGELEFKVADKVQQVGEGATLYVPAGVNAQVMSSAGAKLLTFRTPSAE